MFEVVVIEVNGQRWLHVTKDGGFSPDTIILAAAASGMDYRQGYPVRFGDEEPGLYTEDQLRELARRHEQEQPT